MLGFKGEEKKSAFAQSDYFEDVQQAYLHNGAGHKRYRGI